MRPIERQWRLAESESVEVACDHALHSLDFLLPRLDGDEKPVGVGLDRRDRGWKTDNPFVVREVDVKLVAPVLAELLEVFGAARGRDSGPGGTHPGQPFYRFADVDISKIYRRAHSARAEARFGSVAMDEERAGAACQTGGRLALVERRHASGGARRRPRERRALLDRCAGRFVDLIQTGFR
jgi:hypothetical protein